MKKSVSQPLITVGIPLYDTEPFLVRCLQSVITQDFESFEILVISDASRGRDEKGRSGKKITGLMQKECDKIRKEKKLPPVSLRFLEHSENRGLVEVRRSLSYEARGLFITQLDSDDEMEEGALSALYTAATNGEKVFDIVHGKSRAGTFDSQGNFLPAAENRNGNIFVGEIAGRDVFRRWLLKGDFTANTWGKLIKRDLWLRAYENIPYTYCNLADDLLVFFFIAQYASSYKGIEIPVYRYRVDSGMSSFRKIDSLDRWKMLCSAASVFSVIGMWLENHNELEEDEKKAVLSMPASYLKNNLMQLYQSVIPELQPEAREMLCEYWGRHFVDTVEKNMLFSKSL